MKLVAAFFALHIVTGQTISSRDGDVFDTNQKSVLVSGVIAMLVGFVLLNLVSRSMEGKRELTKEKLREKDFMDKHRFVPDFSAEAYIKADEMVKEQLNGNNRKKNFADYEFDHKAEALYDINDLKLNPTEMIPRLDDVEVVDL